MTWSKILIDEKILRIISYRTRFPKFILIGRMNFEINTKLLDSGVRVPDGELVPVSWYCELKCYYHLQKQR